MSVLGPIRDAGAAAANHEETAATCAEQRVGGLRATLANELQDFLQIQEISFISCANYNADLRSGR